MGHFPYKTISKQTFGKPPAEEKDASFRALEVAGSDVRVSPSGSKVYVVQTPATGKSKRTSRRRQGVVSADHIQDNAALPITRIKTVEDTKPPTSGPASALILADPEGCPTKHTRIRKKARTADFFRSFLKVSALVTLLVVSLTAYCPLRAQTLRYVPQFELTSFHPKMVVFHPKSSKLTMVVNSNGRIDMLDVSNPNVPLKKYEISAAANSAAFAPDGKHLLSAAFDTLYFWKAEDGTLVKTLSAPGGGLITAIAYSVDGSRIASAGIDGTVRVWNVETMAQVRHTLIGHDGQVNSLAFSPDGKHLASAGDDKTVRLWDLETWAEIGEGRLRHLAHVNSVAFSLDGKRLASAGNAGTVKLWDTQDLTQPPMALLDQGRWAKSVAFSPDSRFLVSAGDRRVRVWYAVNGVAAGKPLSGHHAAEIVAAFSPDSKLIASVAGDKTLRLWQVESMSELPCPVMRHHSATYSIAVSPNGEVIASGDEAGHVQLWDVTTDLPKNISRFDHGSWVRAIAFSPDGRRVATGGDDKVIRLWNATTGEKLGNDLRDTDIVFGLAFSPKNGNLLVSGNGDGTVRLWDVARGTQLSRFEVVPSRWVNAVAFSPNGRLLAAGGDPPGRTNMARGQS